MKTSSNTPFRRVAKQGQILWYGKHAAGCVCCRKAPLEVLVRDRCRAFKSAFEERLCRYRHKAREFVKDFMLRRIQCEIAAMLNHAKRFGRVFQTMPSPETWNVQKIFEIAEGKVAIV